MNRSLLRLSAGVVLSAALSAGALLAQGTGPAAGAAAPPPPTYNPVSVETMSSEASAARLLGASVKIPDFFYGWAPIFPNDALRLGFSPRDYTAFRTQPFGSNLICFVPINLPDSAGLLKPNPDSAALFDANPVRGTEIFVMGRVGPRILTADGMATAFQVDHVFLGHEEPRAPKVETKKPVVLKVEKVGPDGKTYTQFWTIKTPGEAFWLPDPSDPDNNAKKLRVTLQF